MEAWVTSALAQAGLGIWAVVATIGLFRVMRRCDQLTDQLIAKAATDKSVNERNAVAQMRVINAILKRSKIRAAGTDDGDEPEVSE